MRTVVIGAGGMLGRDVARLSAGLALPHAELDVTDRAAVRAAIGAQDLVFNCAAYTNVDGAEEHAAEATRVNGDGARSVAEAAGAVVYVSSDYVFDGAKGEPYVESDTVNPLSAYGRSKLAGERATAEANPRHFVVRSSWLFGPGGPNFVETMLGRGHEVRVVDDQVGCPTFTGHLAAALVELAATESYGIHHMAAAGRCSWFEFAREIFARAGVDTRVQPCTTADFPRPAPRPAYSVLRSERGHVLPGWRDGLDAYLGVRV
ncbi:MAG: dTDP-4-dehydrorhamnose reductase [Thermoleophilaceae bacterium]